MLDLDLVKHFAKLLNPQYSQVIEGAYKNPSLQALSEDGFDLWWLVKGRPQYPYWSYLSEADIVYLAEKGEPLVVGNLELSTSNAMLLTLAMRPDVLAKFSEGTADNKPNPLALAGWFFASGIHEHLFSELITPELIRQLDRPVRLDSDAQDPSGISVPMPTVLMVLVWNMLDEKLRSAMEISNTESRYRFIAWFFSNAFQVFRFEVLSANRWKSWLLEDIFLGNELGSLPRFLVMANSLMLANQRPNLKSTSGVNQMKEWGRTQLEKKGQWHWLISKSSNPAAYNFSRFIPGVEEEGNQKLGIGAKPFGLNLIGFAFGELGIGEDIRMAVAACEAAKIPYRIINIQPGDEIRQNDQLLKSQIEKEIGSAYYAINVFIMPGFDTVSRIFLKIGDSSFKGFYNIGWWPWELNVWPRKWGRAFDLVDEIWAGSQFSFEMYQRSTNKPCQLMPLAVSIDRLKVFTRSHFKLPQDDFLFLYIFDFNSHLNRKNPDAAINAFLEAFPAKSSTKSSKSKSHTNVGLVLKVMNTKPKDEAWLRFVKLCAQDSRIHLINTTLNRDEVLGLLETCNAYVSPHRAEGFGRTMAEAMLLGKPVIASNYSGNAFYMDKEFTFPVAYELLDVKAGDYHFVEDADSAQWADPLVSDMGKQMRQALKKSGDADFLQEVKNYASKNFSPIKTGKLVKARLDKLKKLISSQAKSK